MLEMLSDAIAFLLPAILEPLGDQPIKGPTIGVLRIIEKTEAQGIKGRGRKGIPPLAQARYLLAMG
jgi:hypothetical protein